MIEATTCYLLKCDGEGCTEDWGGDFIPHFKTPTAARRFLREAEGMVTRDGKHLCAECSTARRAGLRG